MVQNGKRLADDAIYLDETRSREPKEEYKFIAEQIEESLKEMQGDVSLLDVGCAAGEFIEYLKTRFPDIKYAGCDVSGNLVEGAKKAVPDAEFFKASIEDSEFFKKKKYDFVICAGVLSLFDNIEPLLDNMLSSTKKGGFVYVFGCFNNDPVDVIMRYKLADDEKGELQTGWNVFSTKTYEKILKNKGLEWEWHEFRMPFALEKKPDPMRSWTIKTEENEHQLRNGACQLINMKLLEIKS